MAKINVEVNQIIWQEITDQTGFGIKHSRPLRVSAIYSDPENKEVGRIHLQLPIGPNGEEMIISEPTDNIQQDGKTTKADLNSYFDKPNSRVVRYIDITPVESILVRLKNRWSLNRIC